MRKLNTVGAFIKEKRQAVNLTQAKLATKIGMNSSQSINNIESGRSPFPKAYIAKLCEALNISQQSILDKMQAEYLASIKLASKKTK